MSAILLQPSVKRVGCYGLAWHTDANNNSTNNTGTHVPLSQIRRDKNGNWCGFTCLRPYRRVVCFWQENMRAVFIMCKRLRRQLSFDLQAALAVLCAQKGAKKFKFKTRMLKCWQCYFFFCAPSCCCEGVAGLFLCFVWAGDVGWQALTNGVVTRNWWWLNCCADCRLSTTFKLVWASALWTII